MRRPGFRDAMIALKLYALRREPSLRGSRDLLRSHIWAKEWGSIRDLLDEEHAENQHLRQTMTYWELAASFVNRGMLHPDVFLDACDEGLLLYAALEEHLPRIRQERPRFGTQLEAAVRGYPEIRGRVLELRSEVFKRRKAEE